MKKDEERERQRKKEEDGGIKGRYTLVTHRFGRLHISPHTTINTPHTRVT